MFGSGCTTVNCWSNQVFLQQNSKWTNSIFVIVPWNCLCSREFIGLLKRRWRSESEAAPAGRYGSTGEANALKQWWTWTPSPSMRALSVAWCRLRLEWHTSRGWTTSTVTCEQLTFWLETIWCARSLTLAWLDSLRTTSTQPDKVRAPKCAEARMRTKTTEHSYAFSD